MRIYNNNYVKRGVRLATISESDFKNDCALGFIKEKGMLGEYFSKLEGTEIEEFSCEPDNVDMRSIKYGDETYWYGVNCLSVRLTKGFDSFIEVYKELPSIYNDKTFNWKKNKKYGSMVAVIEDKIFEYHCIVKADGDAVVDVKYNACDNRHRNRVTITTIEISNATNDAIRDAIKEWKRDFKMVIKNA